MAVFYQIIPASIYYLPAGASYAVIFILVSRAGKLQEVLTDIMHENMPTRLCSV